MTRARAREREKEKRPIQFISDFVYNMSMSKTNSRLQLRHMHFGQSIRRTENALEIANIFVSETPLSGHIMNRRRMERAKSDRVLNSH